jgi:hypothetical protein
MNEAVIREVTAVSGAGRRRIQSGEYSYLGFHIPVRSIAVREPKVVAACLSYEN